MALLKWRTVGYDLKPSPRPAQVCPVGEPPPGPCANQPSPVDAGQVGWVLTLTGWDAVSLNSLPDRAVLTQLLNAG